MQQNLFQLIIPFLLLPLLLFALWRLRLKKLAVYNSPVLGKIEVVQKYNGEKVLTTNIYPQGISIEQENVKQSYWFAIAKLSTEFCQNKKNPRILILGLGANTIPNLIAKFHSDIHQTIVEIDEFIILACRKFFDLDSLPNHQLIQADAFKLFNKNNRSFANAQDDANFHRRRFDVIIVDIFLGAPPYISIDSNQPNFIEKLLPYLKKDGVIIFNRPGHTESVRSESKILENYLATLFRKTKSSDIHDPRGFRNTVIAANAKR